MNTVIDKSTRCPICKQLTQVKVDLPYKEQKLRYYFCVCGTVYHDEDIDITKCFSEKYPETIRKGKGTLERYAYVQRLYMPIIEELTYGRESLDVGFGIPENIINLKQRGWLADGIDLLTNDYISGDFITHKFDKLYDLIIMQHVLQNFIDPLAALKKASATLHFGGIIFVIAPDTDIRYLSGYNSWGHWGPGNRVMLSMERFIKEAEKVQFELVYKNRSFTKRFPYWNDFHVIMRKGLVDA